MCLSSIGIIIEPGRPEGPLVISDVQAESVYLSWKPPLEDGGATILGYLIEAKDVLHMDIIKTYIWSEGDKTECLVTGLQTSHIYQFRVYAKNEAGRGEALLNKSLVRVKAANKKPPKASKPIVKIIDDESVLLNWTVPDESQDLNFIVERHDSKLDLWIQCNHGELVRTSYLVPGLLPGKIYKFRISCENAHGVGLPSEETDPVMLNESGDEPPAIIVPVADCFVKDEEPALFSCEYSGTQPITVNWSKDGIRIRDGYRASIATERTKSTLKLEEVDSDDDECLVRCDLRNSEGKASSQGKIIILSPPKINCPSSYKEGLTYDKGDNLRLKVTFSGKPTPCLRWFFNDKEPILDGTKEISLGPEFIEIRICNLHRTDAGIYTFVVENQAGKDSVAVQVTLTGPPCAPHGLPNLELLDADLATLTWDEPLDDGGSSVYNYVVEIRKPEDNEWQSFATVYDTSFQTTDVVSLMKSFFRIRAVNIYGMSEPSQEIQFTAFVPCMDKDQESLKLFYDDKENSLQTTTEMNEPKVAEGKNEIFEVMKMNETSSLARSADSNYELNLIHDETDKLDTHEDIIEINARNSNEILDKLKVEDGSPFVESLDSSPEIQTTKPDMDILSSSEEINEKVTLKSDDMFDRLKPEDGIKMNFESYDSNSKLPSMTVEDAFLELFIGEKFENRCSISEPEDTVKELQSEFLVSEGRNIETELKSGVSLSEPEAIEMECVISEDEFIERVIPLKVIYVATQALMSMPNLNHTCLDVQDFDEVTHFAAEVMPEEEYAIQVIDYIFCYSTCCFVTSLEDLVFDNSVYLHPKFRFESSYVLNDCILEIFDQHFDEIMHFIEKVMPREEYGLQVIDYTFCYVICCLTTSLEDIMFDNSLYLYPEFKFESSCVSNDCYLKNSETLSYDTCFEVILNESIKYQAYFIESSVNLATVTEQCVLIPFYLKPEHIFYAKIGKEYSQKNAVCVYQCPWVMDSLLSVITNFESRVEPTVNYELYDCVTIIETLALDNTNIFETDDMIVRSNSITYIPEEFETLAGLKCVPMTSFKPALSVLPMSRIAQSNIDQRNVIKPVDSPRLEHEREIKLLLPYQSYDTEHHSDSFEENLVDYFNSCDKCGSIDICLCSVTKETLSHIRIPDIYETNVSANRSTYNVFDVTHDQNNICITEKDINNIPDWLRFVSPHWTSPKETSDESILDEYIPTCRELTPENEASKILFKDKSVQELLDLAEEVERSFTQKTEQIESLENILQEELSSLEKDLEVVHEIHRNFLNESAVAWVDDSVVDESAVVPKVCQVDSFGERDLIDFKNDIPRVNIDEMKQEEYAPEVITHLHNRIVQCGCRTRLYCSISGNPDPQIVWLKNGKLLTQSSRYICGNLVEFGLYIDIFNAKSTDTGEYTCIATNCHGSTQTNAYLRVLGPRENSPEEPKFLSSPEDIVAEEGKTVTLDWKITGTPAPHVIWFKNAEKIETSLRTDTFSNHRGCCRLVLYDITAEDNAIYSCYLENDAGSAVSTVLVTVSDSKESNSGPSSMTRTLYDLPVSTDDSDIHSMKYYQKFLENPLPSSKETMVKVRPSRRRKGGLDPPVIPSIVSSGSNWVVLTWSAPTHRARRCGDIQYRVEKRLVDGERWKEVGRTWKTIYTASGLKRGRSYVFRISAGSDGNWGPPAMLAQPVHCRGDHHATVNYDQMY